MESARAWAYVDPKGEIVQQTIHPRAWMSRDSLTMRKGGPGEMWSQAIVRLRREGYRRVRVRVTVERKP